MAENFIAPLLDAVLLDYKRGVPASREPEVLGTMATIVSKLEVGSYVPLSTNCIATSACMFIYILALQLIINLFGCLN